jgi:eukaryotic-like serine/threonine-protein kinase
VSVPTVINLTQAQAEAKLRAAGFTPVVSLVTNAAPKGKVYDQSPQPGEQFPANTKVAITVSSGPGEATVPDVTGYNVDSAKTAIAAVGLTVSKVQTKDDPSVDKGLVIETVPKAGDSVPAGSAVTLTVASGKVKVPDVVGQDQGAAAQALTVVHLKYKTNYKDSDQPEGVVLSQTHRNQVVDASTVIVLDVARAPARTPTTTPTTPPSTATTGPLP